MTKVFDEAHLARAAREAERALADGDSNVMAGRFSPRRAEVASISELNSPVPITVGIARKRAM